MRMAKEHDFEWTEADKKHFAKREEDEVIKIFEKDVTALPGIFEVLVQLVRMKKYNIAIVSSSSTRRIMSCLRKTGLDIFFLPQYIFSAADSMKIPAGKPDPAIYFHAMKEVGARPEECLAVEDSRTGVKAAVAAGVPVIGILQSYNGPSKQEQLVLDFKEDGVVASIYDWQQFFRVLEKLEAK